MRKLTKILALSVLLLANSSYPLSTSAQDLSIPASGWSISFIDKVDPGYSVHYSYTSIAVDSDNYAHVSYRGPDYDLRYATNETRCWLAEIVHDAAAFLARDNSIALDSNNHPHISFSYSDGNAEVLKYATRISATWVISTVDTAPSTGLENDIAVDANGDSHISHYQWNSQWNEGKLRYSTNITRAWTTEVITRAIWARTSIAVDADNKVHIAYASPDGGLKYASPVSGTWELATVDVAGSNPSLAIDSGGTAHISYSTGGSLKYATNSSGSWSTVVITSVASGRDHAIAVDSAGRAHVSFYDPAERSLKYANNVTGGWSIATIDNTGDVGRSNSIAVDSRNIVHISYRDDSTSAMLKYATNGPTPPCHNTTIYLPLIQKQPGWSLAWSDEFNGSGGVSAGNWIYDIGTGYPGGPPNWGTGEVERMSSSTDNVFQSGGFLNIRALHAGTVPTAAWTSGRIETVRTDFQPPAGGLLAVEASIRLPDVTGDAARGYWPAFWILGAPYRGDYQNWPSVGEIDIMENINGLNQWWGALHCGIYPGGPCNEPSGLAENASGFSPGLQEDFHSYRMEFDQSISPQQVRWYVDGVQRHTVYSNQIDASSWHSATNHGFFVILNVAIGGEWPGNPISSTVSGETMLVDYVRVYTASVP